MPVIKIYGLSGNAERVRSFRPKLQRIVAAIKSLKLKPEQVSVYIVHEYAPPDAPDIVAEISGLFMTPARTLRVQNELAQAVLLAIQQFLKETGPPTKRLIEVFVYPFDPTQQGFATSGLQLIEKPN